MILCLRGCDAKVIKKVFIATLVLLNDLHFLDFVKLFVDGTDAIVRASRYNKITQKEVKRLILVNKWDLLHDNTPKSINHTIKGLEEKLEFFQLLVDIGFKEIEVGFPASSETEFDFIRALIERNMIPDDVTIQVLTQAREHIIRKTFEALKGAPRAVVHLYNSTSVAQREQVFKKDKEQIKQLAIDGAALLKSLAEETDGNFSFEYSPESFHGTEVDYALDVCNAVLDVWQPDSEHKAIINIPATVETAILCTMIKR